MSKVVFLGTGTSSGVPLVSCLLKNNCRTCLDSKKENSKNRRRNTSLMVQYKNQDNIVKNILIDVGKFFYHSAIEWFDKCNISQIDAVLITHEHFDAVGGFDDLRDFTCQMDEPLPILLRNSDLNTIKNIYPYLVDTKTSTGGGGIAKLKFIELKDSEEIIDLFGLKITPLEVYHGKNYTCLGFMFGCIVYLSDVSCIPENIMKKIKGCENLILDCLNACDSHPSHFTYQQSLQMVLEINPKNTFFIGMTHEINHEEYTVKLKDWSLKNDQNVKLSYDGLVLNVDL
eukprot:gene119-4365_t